MAGYKITVQVDPEDLANIRRLANPEVTLWPHFREAMSDSLDELEYQAQDFMYANFANTTGRLENGFTKYVGTFESELENDVPYAVRRNYGFTGQTDSLGRLYPWDGGIAWAENAVANSYPTVDLIWQVAIDHALGRS